MYVKITTHQNTQLYSKTEYSAKYKFVKMTRLLQNICCTLLVMSIIFNKGFKFQGIRAYLELTLLFVCYISFIIYGMLKRDFVDRTINMIRGMGKEERDNFIKQYKYKFKNSKIKILSKYYKVEEDIE